MKRNKQVFLFFILIAISCYISFNISDNPLINVTFLVSISSILTFIFSTITREYSWTDRLWSTLPIAMSWIYYFQSSNETLLIVAIMITLWGMRLTFNFARKGGYSSKEDYRWAYLRKQISSIFSWHAFNLLFISIYQQALFIAFTLPLCLISKGNIQSNSATYIFMIVAIAFLILETIADQQQWIFQESKHGRRTKIESLNKSYKQGFRSTGLFAISRHPNYLGELGFWFSIYLLCSVTVGTLINWTFIGPLLLAFLFIGSVIFTENISKGKYEDYKEYQKKVSPVVPLLWKVFK